MPNNFKNGYRDGWEINKTWGEACRYCEKYGIKVKGNTDVFEIANALEWVYQDGYRDGREINKDIVTTPELLKVCKAAKGLLEGIDAGGYYPKGNVYQDLCDVIAKIERRLQNV